MEKYKVLSFPEHGDERGQLIVVEGGMNIPFEIKRVFYMCDSDDTVVRGQHANRKTEFVIINVKGTAKIKVDTGEKQEIINLDKPQIGLYLSRMVWKDMYDFSSDSVLLVLASEHYDATEYIRDYETFCKEVREQK